MYKGKVRARKVRWQRQVGREKQVTGREREEQRGDMSKGRKKKGSREWEMLRCKVR